MKHFTHTFVPIAWALLLANCASAQTNSQQNLALGKEEGAPKTEGSLTAAQEIATFSKHPEEPDLLQVHSTQNGRLLIVDSTGKKWHEQPIVKGSNHIQLGR